MGTSGAGISTTRLVALGGMLAGYPWVNVSRGKEKLDNRQCEAVEQSMHRAHEEVDSAICKVFTYTRGGREGGVRSMIKVDDKRRIPKDRRTVQRQHWGTQHCFVRGNLSGCICISWLEAMQFLGASCSMDLAFVIHDAQRRFMRSS